MKPTDPFTQLRDRLRWLGHRAMSTRFRNEILPQIATSSRDYARLMRLDRPIGALLLLWPTLWALWIAGTGKPDPQILCVFVLGVIVMRSAGCVINDYADRKFDAQVRRTRQRPLASGAVAPKEALILFAVLICIALGLLLTLNRQTQLLALVSAALTVIYPFMKRIFSLPQFVLGAAFSWSVPMAYSAQTGSIPQSAWLLFIASFLWTVIYDTMYAMADRPEDMRIGVKSAAILFGDLDRVIIGAMQFMMLLALWLVGQQLKFGGWYRTGLVLAACFAIYQQGLIRERKPADCMRAFLHNRHLGTVVFIGIALEYLYG
jgi:4-hydroxybenzoate polyprenyltransferase